MWQASEAFVYATNEIVALCRSKAPDHDQLQGMAFNLVVESCVALQGSLGAFQANLRDELGLATQTDPGTTHG